MVCLGWGRTVQPHSGCDLAGREGVLALVERLHLLQQRGFPRVVEAYNERKQLCLCEHVLPQSVEQGEHPQIHPTTTQPTPTTLTRTLTLNNSRDVVQSLQWSTPTPLGRRLGILVCLTTLMTLTCLNSLNSP